MTLTTTQALIIVGAVTLGTIITRFLPFLLFPDNKPIPKVVEYLGCTLPAAMMGLLVCIAQFSIGRFIGHYFNATVDAGQALGQKNTAFAIWIAYTYLNPLSSVGPGCYILWQNIINSIELWMCRRKGLEKSC